MRTLPAIVVALALLAALGHPRPGSAAPTAEVIPGLARSPGLDDYFPYGFWWADGCLTVKSTGYLREEYYDRADKILHDVARHHVNAVIPSNRVLERRQLDLAQKYGVRIATMPLFLHHERPLSDRIALFVQHAQSIKDHPALLGYHLYDEPARPELFEPIRAAAEALRQADPAHPAFYTQNSLPIDVPAEKTLRTLDVHLSDHYSVSAPFGRDPWSYGDIFLPQMRHANPEALHWPVLQAFGYPQMPTVPELRVMVYHTLACGAKGIYFFTAGQAFVHWQDPFYPLQAGNAWFAEDPWLAEIGRMGASLTAAGPLLVARRWKENYPAAVRGPKFRATARGWKECVRRESAWEMPAVHVGAFEGAGGDVLVVHNDDPWQAHQAEVSVSGRGREVYDLYALERVRSRARGGTTTFSVSFTAGDGRLYLVGGDADFAAARQVVLRHRHEQEERLLQLDLALAEAIRVDTARVRRAVEQAKALAAAGDYGPALAAVLRAWDDLEAQRKLDGTFSRSRDALEASRLAFSAINDWFVRHPDELQGETADPRVRALADRAIALTRDFGALENAFRVGKAAPADLEGLSKRVAALRQEVLGYRRPGLAKRRLALLQWGEGSEENVALAEWLRLHTERVDVLPAAAIDSSGAMEGYDLLWIHLGGSAPPVRATYSVAAEVDRRALSGAARAAIRRFVASGGGLVLSGLAACLVDDLGLDPQPPNECVWGSMALPGGIPMAWSGWGDTSRRLGLRPLAPGHPLFAGLPAEGFALWDYDTSELVSRAVWRKPRWPRRGEALAGYWSNGAEIPPEFAAVVEYTRPGEGKVIAVGDGVDPHRGAFWQPGRRAGTPQDRLIRNLVEYCAGG